MNPRKHQSELFLLGVAFTCLHLTTDKMWPFYTLTGFMFVLWALNVIVDYWEQRPGDGK